MVIRQERLTDHDIIYEVIKTSFLKAEHADGKEQDLAAMLRESEAYLPELSLVAEVDGTVVGHVLLQRLKSGNRRFWHWRRFLYCRNIREKVSGLLW